jgi:hypothetical protein
MSSMKAVGPHVMTALVTFALVVAWTGDREARRRAAPVARGEAPAARPPGRAGRGTGGGCDRRLI